MNNLETQKAFAYLIIMLILIIPLCRIGSEEDIINKRIKQFFRFGNQRFNYWSCSKFCFKLHGIFGATKLNSICRQAGPQ